MIRALILVHQWLGILFCLLFAMWFASGVVMHFVRFPSLTEVERVEGLAVIDLNSVKRSVVEAVFSSEITDVTRVRLLQRSDGPIYLVSGESVVLGNVPGLARATALHASDLSSAALESNHLALAIAVDHARRRGMDVAQATLVEFTDYDQWTVSNGLDPHRPLYRVALNDGPGTELYVSSTTGEVVRDTTRKERWWNYAGSVVHWIYPTALRSNQPAWNVTVWWISLVALIGTISGVVLGLLRIKVKENRLVSPYKGWHAWHHWLGLASMSFVLTWIFSGWLSMDGGRLFSSGQPTAEELTIVSGAPAWDSLSRNVLESSSTQAREIEWFAFDRRIYRRERIALNTQRLFLANSHETAAEPRAFLQSDEVSMVSNRLVSGCKTAVALDIVDYYAISASMPDAPVYRLVCDKVWFHIDGANGAMLQKIDPSRRAYRWLYHVLHTLDFPALAARPGLRTGLIVMLSTCGFVFSVTGIVIGWRRLRMQFWRPVRERSGTRN
jgi:hypothetical protein